MLAPRPDKKPVAAEADKNKRLPSHVEIQYDEQGAVEAISSIYQASSKRLTETFKNIPQAQGVTAAAEQRLSALDAEARARVSSIIGDKNLEALQAIQGAGQEEIDRALSSLDGQTASPTVDFDEADIDSLLSNIGADSAPVSVPISQESPTIKVLAEQEISLPHEIAGLVIAMGNFKAEEMHDVAPVLANLNTLLRLKMGKNKSGKDNYDLALASDPSAVARLLVHAYQEMIKHPSPEGAKSVTKEAEVLAKNATRLGRAEGITGPQFKILNKLADNVELIGNPGFMQALNNQKLAEGLAALAERPGFAVVMGRINKEMGGVAGILDNLVAKGGEGFKVYESFFKIKDAMLLQTAGDAKFMTMLTRPEIMQKMHALLVGGASAESVGALVSVMRLRINEDPSLLDKMLNPLVFHELAEVIASAERANVNQPVAPGIQLQRMLETSDVLADVIRQRIPNQQPQTVQGNGTQPQASP